MPIQIINQSKCLTIDAAMNLLMQQGGTLTGMPCHFASSPLWAIAADLCAIGSTRAHKLCEDLGLDPDAKLMVKQVDPRDDEFPCPDYTQGPHDPHAGCYGDGHYLCTTCTELVPDEEQS
jgi:hypothetical protein